MRRIVIISLLVSTLAACIRNDIPYPLVVAGIESIDVAGAKEIVIDSGTRTVRIVLEETADITSVDIRSVSFTVPSATPSWDITGRRDLSKPLKLTLKTYQDYIWTITAVQPIERYFSINGQLSESVIDDVNHRIFVKVAGNADLGNLDISSIKLGPAEISTYTPDPSTVHDFSDELSFKVSYLGKSEVWRVYVEKSEMNVELKGVTPWATIVHLSARGTSASCGFRIKEKNVSDWTTVSAQAQPDGTFSASPEGLTPMTEYEVKAFSGSDETEVRTFTTEAARQLPNPGFEVFSNAESPKFHSFFDPSSPVPELRTKWWDSGNKGSTTVGASFAITMPDSADKTEGNSSVKLASRYVVIKFAAGNIFTGEYYKTIGTSGGVIRFGRPFELHPRKLVLQLKYKSGVISAKTLGGKPDGDPVKVGDNDRGIVWVALGDWDYRKFGGSAESPVEVNTTDRSTFFDRNSEAVIAYGEYVLNQSTDGWIRVEIPLEYHSLTRKPTHIIVSAAASMLGDYFTGSEDSVMWLDDLQLVY